MTSSPKRPLCLWAAPRTVSTAFTKMMLKRQDHHVLTEPFSHAFYLGPERLSARYGLLYPTKTFSHVLHSVHNPASPKPVFLKELPHQLGPLLRPDVVRSFHGSLLIRHPAWVIPSLHRLWPDFTDAETGYEALITVLTILHDAGESPVVLESHDLTSQPERVVGLWCDTVGIQRRPDALNWDPGLPDDVQIWGSFVTNAGNSTCFLPPNSVHPPKVDERLARRIDAFTPLYRQLEVHKLRLT